MISTFFSVIGEDVLSLGQSLIQLISDLINIGGTGGGYGGGTGVYPPGQYPLG